MGAENRSIFGSHAIASVEVNIVSFDWERRTSSERSSHEEMAPTKTTSTKDALSSRFIDSKLKQASGGDTLEVSSMCRLFPKVPGNKWRR